MKAENLYFYASFVYLVMVFLFKKFYIYLHSGGILTISIIWSVFFAMMGIGLGLLVANYTVFKPAHRKGWMSIVAGIVFTLGVL